MAQGAWRITDLGPLTGASDYSLGYAINDRGDAAGVGVIDGTLRAVLWAGGSVRDLGNVGASSPGELLGAEAHGLNNAGAVVGQGFVRTSTSVTSHGFVWRNGLMTQLNGPDAEANSAAYAVNEAGHVAGLATADGATRAALWINGQARLIGPALGGVAASTDINEFDQAVGSASTTSGTPHAFSWQAGITTLLPALVPGFGSAAKALNDSGQIVGTSDSPDSYQAVIWIGGQAVRLPDTAGSFESVANDINNQGQIVGYKRTTSSSGETTPMLWQGGHGYDLNSLSGVAASGWWLEGALGINDSGDIVAFGINPDGRSHGLVLSPVPEPASVALLVAGMALLVVRRAVSRAKAR